MSPSEADPGLVREWLRQRPAWTSGSQDGNATLSRTYLFDDDFDMGNFLARLTELVTADQGHGLAREDGDLSTQATLIHDQPELDRTFLRHAEECDALFHEICAGAHDPFDEDNLGVAEAFHDDDDNDEDDEWD